MDDTITNKFNVVKISSHGEFIDEPLYDSKTSDEGKTKFNIYFRSKVGFTVFTRCNTMDVQWDFSDPNCEEGEPYCGEDFGIKDFTKNMELSFSNNKVTSAQVVGCDDISKIPDMDLSFDDDDFVSGYILYRKNDDGSLVAVDSFSSSIGEPLAKINKFSKENMKLTEVLKKIYDDLTDKNTTIDIYISSCLYIEPHLIKKIKINYPQWFECNRLNISEGYKKELNETIDESEKTKIQSGIDFMNTIETSDTKPPSKRQKAGKRSRKKSRIYYNMKNGGTHGLTRSRRNNQRSRRNTLISRPTNVSRLRRHNALPPTPRTPRRSTRLRLKRTKRVGPYPGITSVRMKTPKTRLKRTKRVGPYTDLSVRMKKGGKRTKKKKGGKKPCWDKYKMVGMKNKNGKRVPNCVYKK